MNYMYGKTKVKIVKSYSYTSFETELNDAIADIETDNGLVKDIKFNYDDTKYFGMIIYIDIQQ